MADVNLLYQGVEMMLFGMGVVLCFLTLLVFLTTLMSTLTLRYVPAAPVPAAPAPPKPDDKGMPDAAALKAIAAAIAQHRRR